MDQKQKQAERELTELIEHCRELRHAYRDLEKRLGRARLEMMGLGDIEFLAGLEQAAQKGLCKLRQPKDEP
jgi:hypothetical protein